MTPEGIRQAFQLSIALMLFGGFCGFCHELPYLVRQFKKHWKTIVPVLTICTLIMSAYWVALW